MLVIDGLTVRYGSETAVKDVHLTMSSTEFLAVTGRSGAGKSTLLNALAGLVHVQAGLASLGGSPLLGVGEPQATLIRRRMGFVFQSATLLPELSVLDNVTWVGRLRGLTRRGSNEAALENLEILGVAHLAARRPGEISGGEAQRVNIARALTGDVALLLVDEPTASLDETTSTEVCAALKTAIHASGVSALVVSHDPIVTKYADRVVRMEQGQLTVEQ